MTPKIDVRTPGPSHMHHVHCPWTNAPSTPSTVRTPTTSATTPEDYAYRWDILGNACGPGFTRAHTALEMLVFFDCFAMHCKRRPG